MTGPTFNAARQRAYQHLTDAQNELLDAPTDRTMEQSRHTRDTLTFIAAAKAELRKAAPVNTTHPAMA